MKAVYQTYKRDIWIGIVVSLITAAIIKIAEWLVAVAPSVGTSVSETLSNIIYTMAATYTEDFLLRSAVLFGLGTLLGRSILPIKEGLVGYRKAIWIEKKAKGISQTTLDEIAEAAATEREEINNKKPESFSSIIKDAKRGGRLSILLIILIVFIYLVFIVVVTTPMNLHNKFEQDMVKIAPYIEESEIYQLKSDWVCMRSKSEYDVIYLVIDKVKEENVLP